MSYILFCYLLTPYLYAVSEKLVRSHFIKETIVITFLLLLTQILSIAYSSYFNCAWVTCYIVGYFIAHYFKKYGEKALEIILFLCMPFCLALCAVRIYFSYIFTGVLAGITGKIISAIIIYSRALLGVTLFLLLYLLLRSSRIAEKVGRSRILDQLDLSSYSVYLVHQMFILSPFTCLKLTRSVPANCSIALAAIIAVAYIHTMVSNRLMDHSKNWR